MKLVEFCLVEFKDFFCKDCKMKGCLIILFIRIKLLGFLVYGGIFILLIFSLFFCFLNLYLF